MIPARDHQILRCKRPRAGKPFDRMSPFGEMVGDADLKRLVQLTSKRSIFVCGRMDGEIVVRRITNNVKDLATRAMDATPGLLVLPVEVLVVEEIEPMRAVVSARGSMEMEGRHNT